MPLALTASHPNQTFFPFIPPLEQAIRAQRWAELESKRKKITISRQFKTKIKSNEDLPIRDFFDEVVRIANLIGEDVSEEIESEVDWNDQDVINLHVYLLIQTLARLNSIVKRNRMRKQENHNVELAEILTWMFQSIIPDQVKRKINGEVVVIDIPFSFGMCCKAARRDPEDVRQKFMPYWREFKSKQKSLLKDT